MKKMKIAIVLALLFLSFNTKAQVGINTELPDSSSILDVSSSIKSGGVLLPRLSLNNAVDKTTIPNPATGLMVYNLANSGEDENIVEANHIYLWNGERWNDLADVQILKKLLLPNLFFCQETDEQYITGTNLSTLNTGGNVQVAYGNVILNNGNNVSLKSNLFTINNTGKYEISGYINYNPGIGEDYNTNLIYKILKSSDNSGVWTEIAQSTMFWGKKLGGYSRTLIIPSSILELKKNDQIKVMISKTYGTNHGSTYDAYISLPGGLKFSKNLRILKLD